MTGVFDAFYFTLVTMTTVGYGDIVPSSNASRVVATIVMVGGIGAGVTILRSLFDIVVSKSIREELGLPNKRVRMKDHYIICGFGNVGLEVAAQLRLNNEKFVVIEKDGKNVEQLVENKAPVIKGDATEERILEKANIDEALGLVTTLDDPGNVIVAITAKMMSPKLYVVSEVEDPINSPKIEKVGTDAIINCHEMGARVMVSKVRKTIIDPVCGVEVKPESAPYKYDYEGQIYYLCGEECYEAFIKNPERFLMAKET